MEGTWGGPCVEGYNHRYRAVEKLRNRVRHDEVYWMIDADSLISLSRTIRCCDTNDNGKKVRQPDLIVSTLIRLLS